MTAGWWRQSALWRKDFIFCWQQLVRRWCYLHFRSRWCVPVLTGLLPAHKYEKYIRLFAGCILLLIVLKPLTDGLRLEERLNYLFTSLSFENEAGELKREMDEIEERRRNMVLSQYEAEASKEAVRVAAEAGFSVEKADVELEKDPESEQFASRRIRVR